MTNKSILLTAFPLLLFACGQPTTDDANDAAGTGGGELAREVVGIHLLSTDANYDAPCNYLAEEFVTATFQLQDVTLEKFDQPNGCDFEWGNNKIGLMMGGRKPFPSIYHAEYVFDRLYQPNPEKLAIGQEMVQDEEREPLSGPDRSVGPSEGTGSEGADPTSTTTTPNGAKGSVPAANDTARTISGVTRQAGKFVEPSKSGMGFVAVMGVGDKAVWEPAKQTMHVLYNNHILNVLVKTADSETLKRQRAATLAKVILNQIAH